MVQVDAMELCEETSSNSDPRNIVLFFWGDPEKKNPIDIYRSFLYMLVFDSISIACSWRLVYCTRQWVCHASLRNCRIESTRNIHHLLYYGNIMGILWEYYGNIMGILWEYYGNIMGILWEYYGNIMGILMVHMPYSNLAVFCRLASPQLGLAGPMLDSQALEVAEQAASLASIRSTPQGTTSSQDTA